MRRRLALAEIVFVLLVSTRAFAAPDPEKLFIEGSALLEKGRCTEGLPMLEQSQKLDPGIGTQFNIALCDEQLGRLGTAWRNFSEVEKFARVSGKKQREEAAHQRLEALRTKVPTLKLSAESDLTVKVDGSAVAREDWAFVPVDPGDHEVEATAPTKKSWTKTVRAPGEGNALEVVVPRLELVQKTDVVTVTNKRRTLGFVIGGVGVAGAVAAALTGVMILDAKSTADEQCRPKCVDQDGVDAVNRGKTLVPINIVAWAVAAVGLGVGTLLVLTAPSSSSAATTTGQGSPLRFTF